MDPHGKNIKYPASFDGFCKPFSQMRLVNSHGQFTKFTETGPYSPKPLFFKYTQRPSVHGIVAPPTLSKDYRSAAEGAVYSEVQPQSESSSSNAREVQTQIFCPQLVRLDKNVAKVQKTAIKNLYKGQGDSSAVAGNSSKPSETSSQVYLHYDRYEEVQQNIKAYQTKNFQTKENNEKIVSLLKSSARKLRSKRRKDNGAATYSGDSMSNMEVAVHLQTAMLNDRISNFKLSEYLTNEKTRDRLLGKLKRNPVPSPPKKTVPTIIRSTPYPCICIDAEKNGIDSEQPMRLTKCEKCQKCQRSDKSSPRIPGGGGVSSRSTRSKKTNFIELVEVEKSEETLNSFGDSTLPDTSITDSETDMDEPSENDNDEANDDESSSDSGDEAYRGFAYKLTHSPKNCFAKPVTSKDALKTPSSPLVPSLFPNVPPYIAFSSYTQKGPNISATLYGILRWRHTKITPKIVRSTLINSGFRLIKNTNDWVGVWGKHMRSPLFKMIRPHQKINHMPGSFRIGRKDSCWSNLCKLVNKYGKENFGFMPKTYIIPRDLASFRKNWLRNLEHGVKWIIKPPARSRGFGVHVVDRWEQIPKKRPVIIQKYIDRPLLIGGAKFDLRLYVLVTSVNPLRVYMYHDGLVRFASEKYSGKSETLNNRCMHLTNYSINKKSRNYAKNDDVYACHGHKWTLKSLWAFLEKRGVHTDSLWEAMRNLVLRTILAAEDPIDIMMSRHVEARYSCFELFGFDVLLDGDLVPWLLEVNISPSLHSELPLDEHVKGPLVQSILNTGLFNLPPTLSMQDQLDTCEFACLPPGPICYDKRMYESRLSPLEYDKHTTFGQRNRFQYMNDILMNLTPDDVRCLIVAEDELARSSPLERIFPTSETHKYLDFMDRSRYYDRLLDAWETHHGSNRSQGIRLLRTYCEQKYHLEVPPPTR